MTSWSSLRGWRDCHDFLIKWFRRNFDCSCWREKNFEKVSVIRKKRSGQWTWRLPRFMKKHEVGAAGRKNKKPRNQRHSIFMLLGISDNNQIRWFFLDQSSGRTQTTCLPEATLLANNTSDISSFILALTSQFFGRIHQRWLAGVGAADQWKKHYRGFKL